MKRLSLCLTVYVAIMLIVLVIAYAHINACDASVYERCGTDPVRFINWVLSVSLAHVALLGYGIYRLITKRDLIL